MMLALLALSISAEFAALDRAVESCTRETVTPAFAAEAKRRNGFLTTMFAEQEAVVAARLDLADRRRALREAGAGDGEPALLLAAQAIEDRQRALNDRRMLENMRNEAMDAKRRFYLSHCATKDRK